MPTLQIDVISDVVCPWCFVGKRQLEQAIAAYGKAHPAASITVRWHPFQLNPGLPSAGVARSDYLKAKFGSDDTGRYLHVRRAASEVALELNLEAITRQPNTLRAHALIEKAGDTAFQDAMVEALFVAYFQNGRDLTDEATLRDIATTAGLPQPAIDEALHDTGLLESIAAADQRARGAGINGVPCFVVNRRYSLSGAQGMRAIIELFEDAASA